MENKKELTTIEWNVYNEIKERTLNGEWTSVEYLSSKYNVGKRTVRKFVNTIRANDVIQKIIITSFKFGYKLMTDEEQFLYLEKRKIHILKQLKQYYKDVKRYNLNGQYRITFGDYERKIYESLLEEKNVSKEN